jgi:hypothetical protein
MNTQPKLHSADTYTSNLLPEILRFKPRRRYRTDKIARLPQSVRDSINHLLDEGLPYKQIIQNLGPHGKGLTKQNLSRWKQGPYQEYLKDQDFKDFTRHQMEFAARLLREIPEDSVQIRESCSRIAALQTLDALMHHGSSVLKHTLQNRPESILSLYNTICNLANADLNKRKARSRLSTPKPPTGSASSPA